MKKLLYISTGLPKEEVDRLRKKQIDFSSNAIMPISIFNGNILAGLVTVYDKVCALSGVPISHRNFKVFRYATRKIQKGNLEFDIPGFFNLPGIKQLTIAIKLFFRIIDWYSKNKADEIHIIIDGTFKLGLGALWLASGFVKTNTCAIIVDYYSSFMDPTRNSFSQKIYYKLLQSIDKFVFVTDHLEKLINIEDKPFIIMEGLVDSHSVNVGKVSEDIGNCCVYAGGLHTIYGVGNLVDAFHESNIAYKLHLYGNGNLVDYIKEISSKDPRIEYKGVVSHDELLEVERRAKLLVNPRPVYGELDTRYNFPSKLMEYMQSGRPVITTKLLGIPAEYANYMYYFDDDTKEKIGKGLKTVLSIEEETLSMFGKRAQKYVNENKNNFVIAKRMIDLISTDGEVQNEEVAK